MPPFYRRRCIEILLTIFAKGHRLDPEQAIPYQTLVQLRRQLSRRPDLQPLVEDIRLAHQ